MGKRGEKMQLKGGGQKIEKVFSTPKISNPPPPGSEFANDYKYSFV